MRLCMAEGDDWTPEMWNIHLKCVIHVDGKEVRYCVTADEEQGYVDKYKQDENGNIVAVGDEIALERIEGHVEIISKHRKTPRG